MKRGWVLPVLLAAFGLAFTALPGVASAAAECQILPGGTLGDEEPPPVPDRAGSPTDKGPGARGDNPTVGGLPTRVDLHSTTMGQNRNYYFAVKGGRLYVKPNYERTGKTGSWQHVTTPDCLDGDIQEIDVDDDELVAINSDRQIFGMDKALEIPSEFNWSSRWGFPFWKGDGYTVPDDAVAWAWTVISPRESEYWVDPAGNHHAVGEGKCSHVLSLRGDRTSITMNDPWLPKDRSYEVGGPRRGTFKVSNLAASGSVLFVIGNHGDMYTRLWDFDIAGLDNLFFSYSYEDQRGIEDPAVQLPGAHWVQQPKINGKITNRISITTIGRGTEHRILRVEGRNAKGVPGFWQKDLYVLNRGSAGWKFVATPKARVTGKALDNPRGDTSAKGAVKAEDSRYVLSGSSYTAEIPDFNLYLGRSVLRLYLHDGDYMDLNLFLDDVIRTTPRERGLDGEPRQLYGTIGVTAANRRLAATNEEAREFIENVLGNKDFTKTWITVTTSSLSMDDLGLTFNASNKPSTLPVKDPAFKSLALSRKGKSLKFSFETTTESPASIVVKKTRNQRGKKVSRVAARLTRTGTFTWNPRRLARGTYKVKVSSMGLGGRLDSHSFKVKRTGAGFKTGR
ncbi:MAG: hypothetical protein J0H66_01065 [Solirubrobacterales bacterium]|nr:hypothetical protein [Solirubrobacterales bacterium]OJU94265.1 MAG: hypothetical protein BGO23_02270 [Solirubrobacterales bacterium 67-14]